MSAERRELARKRTGPERPDACREDVLSNAAGEVTFNYLQQTPASADIEEVPTPLEEAGTTDPDGITTG